MSIERECGWKVQYDTKGAAKRAARKFSSFRGGRPAYAYLCSFCNHFHIGHKPRRNG